ncbi:ABC transporter substrate-binding protein [Pseudomonas sp. NFACC39-1]|uniref:ABC transporter substrate-binding protein n=1 Tax=Pseudomonas sp. NFACC39-1 TaxID=1566195 RepID=UPI0008C02F2A|nr:ABC transporter substrate-binding protein [Pseudomonas sp. NFACC39-1]SEO07834.1 substrate-binding protein [Pseudomonas sp. NFACC39-1]
MSFCIGISAIFESFRTVHARTFLAAINHFINTHDTLGLRFVFEDDDASPQGGRRAAQNLIAKGVDVVVGHFSSDAAAGALPLYQASGIPVLLPAATKQDLLEGAAHAFRLCPSDKDLMELLAKNLIMDAPRGNVLIVHDSTEHGKSLARVLTAILAGSSMFVAPTLELAEVVVYCGRLNNSIRYVNSLLNEHRDLPIYLTDDALSNWFIQNTSPLQNLRIVGLVTAEPTYFQESLAALQIARTLSHCGEMLDALQTATFNTVLGQVQFCNGQNRFAHAALWEIRDQRFIPSTSA